jgi:predicted RNA-binding Zn-ribbon protein involved in translation (DUF1610 family)
MIPATGTHAFHWVEERFCSDCNHPLTRADYRSVACPKCGVGPQLRCRDADGPRDAVHQERMLVACGYDPAAAEVRTKTRADFLSVKCLQCGAGPAGALPARGRSRCGAPGTDVARPGTRPGQLRRAARQERQAPGSQAVPAAAESQPAPD